MATDVTAFTAAARAEFMQGKLDAESRVMPAEYEKFTTRVPSTSRVETHTYMSALPRLRAFKGYGPISRLVTSTYTVENVTYRIGPVAVTKEDLDDDQIGGYMQSIRALPAQGEKDIGFRILDKIVDGTTDLCFDGTAFFANSHTVGSGDNLDTVDNTGNDGVTHYMIGMVLDNPTIKPVIFQDRESLSELKDDTSEAMSEKKREYEFWADCRFGLAYGFWWDAVHLTITDTPTLTEAQSHLESIVNRFRTFTLPKGEDLDDALYVHENWMPSAENFVILCNMKLGEILETIRGQSLIAAGTSGATITNKWVNRFTVIPTSALGA